MREDWGRMEKGTHTKSVETRNKQKKRERKNKRKPLKSQLATLSPSG